MTTFAPRLDNCLAIPFPIPVPPPVINATLSLKVSGGNMGDFCAGKYSAAPLLYCLLTIKLLNLETLKEVLIACILLWQWAISFKFRAKRVK